jgi:predicted nuclease of predicted toxin-antitoxin system
MTSFKLDENLPTDLQEFLRAQGHDAVTVWDQKMRGQPDARLAEACRREGRAHITLDLGFADIRAYPPELFSGLIVLRLRKQSRRLVLSAFSRAFRALSIERVEGRLWIVEEASLRIRGPED